MTPKDKIKGILPFSQQNGREYTGNRYACLVNRKTVIDTLEKKANVTGFRYIRPADYKAIYNKAGTLLRYDRTEPFDLLDVDSTIKKTVKTSHYLSDKITPYPQKKAAIGVWVDELAGAYHGKNSQNWKQEYLTLQEIIDTLNKGYSIAPGEFQAPAGESIRSAKHCLHREFILFDADEWTPDHPAPADISELIKRYPDIPNDFYFISESISSRSSLKPELRCRLMLVLPTPIHKGEETLWQTVIDAIVAKYPFIARGVGIDKVRLSFGNARPDCENRIKYGIKTLESFHVWEQETAEKQAQAEKDVQALAEQKERQAQARQQETVVRTELKRRGYELSDQPHALVEFCKTVPEPLLTNYGIATHLQGKRWHYIGSTAGSSFELVDGIIKPFSNSVQAASPEKANPTKPVNAHRFIAWVMFGLDMKNPADKRQLREDKRVFANDRRSFRNGIT